MCLFDVELSFFGQFYYGKIYWCVLRVRIQMPVADIVADAWNEWAINIP